MAAIGTLSYAGELTLFPQCFWVVKGCRTNNPAVVGSNSGRQTLLAQSVVHMT